MKALIYVTLKPSVLDPQGKAVRGGLHSLGFTETEDVRVGKYIELTLAGADRPRAEARVKEMCEKLLANTVIEQYRFEIVGVE
ncbi:MAG TPA: phosphoribosylformylglycinamidine synthase subunit PurS [Patescibacteria group bacterium]|jgi:phosphoribosylformylglycinamidine synthase|nr:phosphoribosylformylglycinamidine synthase subunit PurS [Patescibacteria group bacterium]